MAKATQVDSLSDKKFQAQFQPVKTWNITTQCGFSIHPVTIVVCSD